MFIQRCHLRGALQTGRSRVRFPMVSVEFFSNIIFLLTPLASSSTVLRHVFLGLPLPHLPWGLHSRACLAMMSGGFHSVRPSHPHLHFLICKSILGCFMHFHSSLFIIWSSQKILNIFKCFQLYFNYEVLTS